MGDSEFEATGQPVAKGDFGVSLPEDIQKPPGHGPEQVSPGSPA